MEKNELGVKIGLEVHVSLTTDSKLFCGCSTKWQGQEPNSSCCPTCLGMPGSKPRLNKKAVDYGIKIGLALNCKIAKEMFFSRKSYFYPDMSKNFQITQYEMPLCSGGKMKLGSKEICIRRIQLEEDPARLVHEGISISESKYVLIDYNRSGDPLCEIVTEPDFENPREARLFLQKLSAVLEYLGVYDSGIEGSMKVDANISIKNGERVEIKNITGFKEVEKALTFEIIRQGNLLKRGKKVSQETRGFDDVSGTTILQRTKEFEEEYGYIFEPDLTKIEIEKAHVDKIEKALPELPDEKIKKYKKLIGEELAESIVTDMELAKMFEIMTKDFEPKLAATWFGNVLKKILNYNNMRFRDTGITEAQMSRLLKSLRDDKITPRTAEMILREMVKPGSQEISSSLESLESAERIGDHSEIRKFVLAALEKNPKAITDYKSGRNEAFEFIVGQVMRESKGRADPKLIREVLKEML
jgi:aspartyl-tRNA(Asn)/glutamyl-tRNA(Gln) amidotransferase subunit B